MVEILQLKLHVHQTREGRVPVDLVSECHKSTFVSIEVRDG